ncbi:MAG: MotA/TolQ/ExbB proton channel family protein [Rhodothermales bacterium]
MNRLLRLFLVIIAAGVFVALGGAGLSAGAESAGSALLPVQAADAPSDGFTMNNLWTLTEQAGPLRWPIFLVFIIGMFLVTLKWFELMSDRRESKDLEHVDFRLMGLPQIIKTISGQKDSMLARLHATMLNVFQSQQNQADLHDEIANYIRYQQDRFDTFKRRVDFMSDTAGALGLLGTVWGIFTVFSQGLLDDQVILTGMGFALITTLMGLIVSIILNLSSTEVFGFFNRRLERIGAKSDELRFRLMELALPSAAKGDTHLDLEPLVNDHLAPVVSVSGNPVTRTETVRPAPEGKPIAQVEAVLQDRFSNSAFTAIRVPLHCASRCCPPASM